MSNVNRKNTKKYSGSKDSKLVKGMNQKTMNKRNSTKNQRRDKEIADTAIRAEESTSNPYTWYANFPNYMKDVASLNFATPVGQPLYLNGGDYVANAGIMTIEFCPTVGISSGLTSPINRQAARLYTYLRSIQRAAATYDSADLFMYLFGVDSLYMYWSYLRRAYGVAQLFTPVNKYYPRRLLQSMGIDPSIANNLADFRAYINRFALNIGRFAAPKDFDLFNRHSWMCNGLYLDSKSMKAQTYMFVPSVLYKFDNTVTTGSQLQGIQFGSFTATPQSRDLTSLIAFGDSLINAMELDEDTMNISGDLYRAYGESGLYRVEETPDNYAIVPIYDETVLSQIENLTIAGMPCATNDITQFAGPVISQNPAVNNGAILFSMLTTAGGTTISNKTYRNYPLFGENNLMNFHWDQPTYEQITEASRLMTHSPKTMSSIIDSNPRGISVTIAQVDVVTNLRVCITSLSNPDAVQFLYTQTQTCWQDANLVAINDLGLDMIAILQQFDWAPMVYIVQESGNTGSLRLMAADVDVFSAISNQQLYNITEGTILSLTDCPRPSNI